MTTDDVNLLIGIGFCIICFFLGRASMMHTILKAVSEEAEKEKSLSTNSSSKELTVEKIDNMYYAYVGTDFAGQADNFDDLISNMVKDHRFSKVKVNSTTDLSAEEQQALIQALKKNYNQK